MSKWNSYKIIGKKVILKKWICWGAGFLLEIIPSSLVGMLIPALQGNFLLLWMIGVFLFSIRISVRFLKQKESLFSAEELKEIEFTITILEVEIFFEVGFIVVLLYSFITEVAQIL